MLTTAEILKKVKELEIKSKKITRHLFTGEYHSAFKGRGMTFREVREYAPGDDIRFIDWNVSARLGHPYSKLFEEERELSVFLLVDISASSAFGTTYASKKDFIAEIGSVLTFSAVSNNDKVGIVFFSNVIEKYIPLKKGKQHALYIVRNLLTQQAQQQGTSLSNALKFLNNSSRQKSIVFILSDFLDTNFEDALRIAGKKHDVTGIKIYDKMEMQLSPVGLLQVTDAETGQKQWVDSSDARTRRLYEDNFFKHTDWCKNVFTRSGCDLLHVRTDDDYVKILQKFFASRT